MKLRTLALIATLSLAASAQQEPAAPSPARSVVQVVARSDCSTGNQGSGIIVEPGIILTSAHVVQGAEGVKVILNGNAYVPSAHILAPELDLCLLRVPALPGPPVLFAEEAAIRLGTKVQAIGFPAGQGLTIRPGTLTGLWQFRGSRLIQTDSAVRHGNSGGGLFTEDGRLLGITTFALLAYEGLNFCVPASWIPTLLRRPWQEGSRIQLCRSRELFLLDFLDGMTENPSNRPAWEAFSRAWIASRPKDPEAWFSLGYTLSLRASEGAAPGLPDPSLRETARDAYRKAIELNPGFARAWNNLGVVQDELGDSEAAVISLKMAVRLRDDYGLAWLNLGSACFNARRHGESAEALRRGLALIPDDAPSWARLAFCEDKLGQRDAAIRHLRTALSLYPMRVEWWLDLASACRRAKRQPEFEAALDFLRARLPAFAHEVALRAQAPNL